MDIDSYLNYFNDHEADQNVIYSADMAIIVKKNIGKLYCYKSLVVGGFICTRSRNLGKEVNKNIVPFWAQPTSKLKFHSAEEQKIKKDTMEESLGLGKKSYGTKTYTKT